MRIRERLAPMSPYHIALLVMAAIVIALAVALLSPLSPQLTISIAGGLIATLLVTAFGWLRKVPSPPRVWPRRDRVRPTLADRMERAREDLFLVGFSFETTLKDQGKLLVQALNGNPDLTVRMLMLNPSSPHAQAHAPFSARPLAARFALTEDLLRQLYDALSDDARHRLEVRATHYLPRFAARVFDRKSMLIGFYLLNSAAFGNPMIEVKRSHHREAFDGIRRSLLAMYDYDRTPPNVEIIQNGRWYGLPRPPKPGPAPTAPAPQPTGGSDTNEQ